VNYYEHHIRDYDAATAHLTWEEDLAYTRLLRWYYRKEQPIPSDVKEACRQVRAMSKPQRDAVDSVLREFFSLRDDGWHNETCDDVINRFKDGEPEREVKKANEENRLKRHRDERARLFKVLTDAGEHAPWNIKMEDLREMVARVSAPKPETKPATTATAPATPATAPATPATATQSPITNHQSPVELVVVVDQPSQGAEQIENATRVGSLCKQLRLIGIDAAPHLPAWPDLLERFTDEQIVAVAQIAKERKPNERIHLNYLVPILNEPPKAPANGAKRKPAPENFDTRDYGQGGRL